MGNSITSWISSITGIFVLIVMVIGLLIDIKRGLIRRKSSAIGKPALPPSFIHNKKVLRALAVMVILIVAVPVVARMIPIKNKHIRQDMIDEDTRITKESEKCITYHVQCNSQEARQKITFYLAPPEIQNEIIMDAMDCARRNKLVFSPKTEINEYDQYKIVRDYVEETPTNIMPLLLTNDECLNITKHVYDAGGFNKDLLVLMRYILNERSVMRDLEYKFQVESQEILLTYYDKIGIISSFINMQKVKIQEAGLN